ncbi:MAG: tRNA pseudouridine(38-40) synthase TruA [Lachnospiraceae bacterium]|nr:tRNA pseudouridine(38-40) synthase TruA [Lachnospiraceae bacterium]
MMRVKLIVAYDGTNYNGYQSQVNGTAVQDVLEKAIADLFGRQIRTLGASRTDTGVHAAGNVAVFDVDSPIEPSRIAFALNARLPQDIRILDSEKVPDDFHPRFQRTVKTYEYHILNRKFPDPLRRNTELHYYYALDADAMDEAARMLMGEHDFASFAAAGYSSKTTVREIYDAHVTREGDRVTFTITGTGFLYNMVRILAGTLIEIGAGKYAPEHMRTVLDARNRKAAGPTAPAKGLVLLKIQYPDSEV